MLSFLLFNQMAVLVMINKIDHLEKVFKWREVGRRHRRLPSILRSKQSNGKKNGMKERQSN
jgi:hypothetical protein